MTAELDEARAVLAAMAGPERRFPGRVTVDLASPVARITLANPTARNAITLAMMVDLADAVRALEEWTGAAVLVVAEGDSAFCSGGHLRDVRDVASDADSAARMSRAMTAVLDRLLALPCVSVAAIGGPALGGGAEIALACDFRVLGPRGVVHFVQSRLGIASGWGGVGRLVQCVGPRTALRIAASGEPIGGADAIACGLADAVASDPVEDGATAWLAPMLAAPPAAVRAAKRQVVARLRGTPEDGVAAFAELWGGSAHRAALAARGW